MNDLTLRTVSIAALGWAARLAGLALFLLVATLVVGHGGPPAPWTQPPRVAAELWLMLIMTVGLVIGWRWEIPGATATLGALVGINILELIFNHRFAGGAFPLFAVPAILYVAHAVLRRWQPAPTAR